MEAPITPICKPVRYLILAAALAGAATPACAGSSQGDLLKSYARARAAESVGAPEEAAAGYAMLLAAAPNDAALAQRTYVQALNAGNRETAIAAARLLPQDGSAEIDVQLLLLSDALQRGRRDEAASIARGLAKDPVFAFMAPIIEAWLATDARRGDPLARLAEAEANPLATSYAAEQRPLLLLAAGDYRGGIQAFAALEDGGLREQRLRIAGAALLARKGKRNDALALLAGDAPALDIARARIGLKKRLPEVSTPAAGVATLVSRLAGELHRQKVSDLGLRFARIATFLDPASSEAWLMSAELLAAEGGNDAALAALGNIAADDPFAPVASGIRIRLLVANEDHDRALAAAQATADRPDAQTDDWVTLGHLLMQMDKPADAAAAYGRAQALWPTDAGQMPWVLHLLRGSALETAGDWPAARTELQAAHRLAPNEASVLNHLGYAQLERRENVADALKLVSEASRLEPDSHEITDSLGWGYFLSGETGKAIDLLERAAAGEPADAEINEHLGDAYYRVGRRYEARYAWRAALLNAAGIDADRLTAKIERGWTAELASP